MDDRRDYSRRCFVSVPGVVRSSIPLGRSRHHGVLDPKSTGIVLEVNVILLSYADSSRNETLMVGPKTIRTDYFQTRQIKRQCGFICNHHTGGQKFMMKADSGRPRK